MGVGVFTNKYYRRRLIVIFLALALSWSIFALSERAGAAGGSLETPPATPMSGSTSASTTEPVWSGDGASPTSPPSGVGVEASCNLNGRFTLKGSLSCVS